ncbi:MAG: hypothetical protein R2749_30090 [Acidimicrobiales bacterium]
MRTVVVIAALTMREAARRRVLVALAGLTALLLALEAAGASPAWRPSPAAVRCRPPKPA